MKCYTENYIEICYQKLHFLIDSANLMMNIEHYERRECLYFFHPLRYLKQFNSAHGQAIQNELKQFDKNSCLIFSSDSLNNVGLPSNTHSKRIKASEITRK